jgi:hypothetical protein
MKARREPPDAYSEWTGSRTEIHQEQMEADIKTFLVEVDATDLDIIPEGKETVAAQ